MKKNNVFALLPLMFGVGAEATRRDSDCVEVVIGGVKGRIIRSINPSASDCPGVVCSFELERRKDVGRLEKIGLPRQLAEENAANRERGRVFDAQLEKKK